MPRSRVTYQRLWLSVWLMGLLCALATRPAWAHGGDESMIQLQDVYLAGYRLTVMTAPRVLLAGPMHVVILVTDPTGVHSKIIQQMTVEVIPLSGGGSRQISPALPMLPLLGSHEAQLVLTQPGRYQVQLHIPGSPQPATFVVDVISGSWMQALLFVLLGVTVAAAGWLVKEGFIVWRRQPVISKRVAL